MIQGLLEPLVPFGGKPKSAAAISPTTFPSLEWYRQASDFTGLVNNDPLPASWNESSSHALACTTTGAVYKTPAFGLRPGVFHDGTDDLIACDGLATPFTGAIRDMTVVAEIKPIRLATGQTILGFGHSTTNTQDILDFNMNSSNAVRMQRAGGSGSQGTADTPGNALSTSIALISWQIKASDNTCRIRVNQVALTSPEWETITNTTSATLNRFRIGALQKSGTFFFNNFQWRAIAVFTELLSDANLVAVENYIRTNLYQSALTLNEIFADNDTYKNVLQRNQTVPIFGTALPGETIEVTFRSTTLQDTVGGDGEWRVDMPTGAAGGPFTLTVSSIGIEWNPKTITQNYLVGEVIAIGGQSNAQFALSAGDATEMAAAEAYASDTGLRNCAITQNLITRVWLQLTTGTSVDSWSALGFWFSSKVRSLLGGTVPVGFIRYAVNATYIEDWMTQVAFDASGATQTSGSVIASMYNERFAPSIPYRFGTLVWWHGEANANDAAGQYRAKLDALIDLWRADCGFDFPVIVIQTERINSGDYTVIREEQKVACESVLTKALLSVSYPNDPTGNLHPDKKRDTGEFAAMQWYEWSEGGNHGGEDRGPVCTGGSVVGGVPRVTFTHASGLATSDGAAPLLETRRGSGSWAAATGTVIVGTRIDFDLPAGTDTPIQARYAISNNPSQALKNSAGFWASPFTVTLS